LAANLSGVFPAGALIAIFAAMWIRQRGWSASVLIDRLLLPAVVPVFLIAIVPVVRAERDMSYFGERSLAASIRSLTGAGSLAEIVVALLAALVAAIWIASRGARDTTARRTVSLAGGAAILSVLVFVAAHQLAGFPYPSTRYGLLLIWLALV